MLLQEHFLVFFFVIFLSAPSCCFLDYFHVLVSYIFCQVVVFSCICVIYCLSGGCFFMYLLFFCTTSLVFPAVVPPLAAGVAAAPGALAPGTLIYPADQRKETFFPRESTMVDRGPGARCRSRLNPTPARRGSQ